MKATTFLRSFRLSALLLGTALCVGAVAAPRTAQACGPYGVKLSAEEWAVVDAAYARLPVDGTVFVVEHGKARIEGDRALVSLRLFDNVEEREYWRTFRFVRGEGGWLPAPSRRA